MNSSVRSDLAIESAEMFNKTEKREFDTSLIKKVPQSLIIGLFFCQLFRFTI